MTPEEYVEEVLALVERIPPGRAMSYGAIADVLAERSGRNSSRLVGSIMARHGGGVTPMRPDGRVDLRRASWTPSDQ